MHPGVAWKESGLPRHCAFLQKCSTVIVSSLEAAHVRSCHYSNDASGRKKICDIKAHSYHDLVDMSFDSLEQAEDVIRCSSKLYRFRVSDVSYF